MKHWKLASLLLSLSFALSAGATIWDVSPGFEGEPLNSDPVSQGDDEIRLMRKETRFRNEVEHHFGTAASDDNGTHRVGSARCFIQNAAPTVLEVADYANSIGTSASGTATLSNNATNSSPAELLGLGRCWIDLDGPDNSSGTADDNKLYVYGASGWAVVSALSSSALPYISAISAGSYNLVFNGSFEGINNGATAVPEGWSISNSPTISYGATDTNMGVGRKIRLVAASATSADGISQTLSGLKPSTTYTVISYVKEITGNCKVTTSGGAVNVNADGNSASFASNVAVFITDATPTAVTLTLSTDSAGPDTDSCDYDHVAVYEQSSVGMPQAGIVPTFVCSTASSALGGSFTTLLTRAVSVPGPGYYIRVTANAAAIANTGNDMQLDARIREDATTVRDQRSQQSTVNGAITSIGLNYIKTNPTPGSTYSYTLELAENGTVGTGDFNYADASGGADLSTNCLAVELIPVR